MTSMFPKSLFNLSQRAVLAAMFSSGAAMAQSPAAGCTMRELATEQLTFTEDLRPLVDASINGNAVSAVLNTGAAQRTILNKKMLDRLGIKVNQVTSTRYRDYKDSRGNVVPTDQIEVRDALTALVQDYATGPVQGKNLWFVVEDFIDDKFGARIGAESLLQNDVELALDAGYVKYFKPDGCFREHLAYWDSKAVSVPTNVDVWKRDPRPIFKITINGKDAMALLSTATPHSYLPASAAGNFGLAPTSAGALREEPIPGHGQDKPVWNVPLAEMSVGGLQVKDFTLRLMDLPYSGELVILGADFLHRHRVYIAMSQGQIYFSPIENPTPKRGSVKVVPQPIGS